MAGAAAAGTGDHTRGRTSYLHPLHARIHTLINMMLVLSFRLAKEIFSSRIKHLITNGLLSKTTLNTH